MAIRVYEYGLLPPTGNAAVVDQQMRDAHRYRNVLVEIEHERRASVRAAMGAHPDMQPLEEQVAAAVAERDAARQQISDTRKATRSRSESGDLRKVTRDLGAKLRDLRALIKAARAAVAADPVVKEKITAAETHAHDRQIQSRADCNVYWGTYLLQEADAQRARQEKFPPKFRRWTGAGRVSVQLQGGLPVSDLFGNDTQVQINPVSPDAYDQGCARGVRRRASRTVLRIRVGSDKRKPIWAEWPMIMHRAIPDGSVIKVATVSKRPRDCRTWFWHVQLTVEVPDEALAPAPTATGVCALNLGYCLRPNGDIRSGYVVGSDGYEVEILMPKRDIEALEKADSIRSIRDKLMNTMQAAFVEWKPTWLATNKEMHERVAMAVENENISPDGWQRLGEYIDRGGPALPFWFAKRTQHVHVWKSAERFRSFAFAWREQRFGGDAAGYELVEAWRYRDEHLQRYEANMRRTALIRRRDRYRMVAAQLRQLYRILVVDDTDLRELQRSPAPESERTEASAVKSNQRMAAGSVLRGTLTDSFGKRFVKLSGKNLTVTCYHCGHLNQVERSGSRVHECTNCGRNWDQDANFCRNLLRSYNQEEARKELEGPVAVDDAPKGRWKRVKATKAAIDASGSVRDDQLTG
jgi:ribosomal protein L37AE/L43A